MSALVICNEVELRRGGKAVLSNVSLELVPGGIVGVIGPNGAGKTTLMSAIAARLPVAGGTITVNGYGVMDHPLQVRRSVSMASAPSSSVLAMRGVDYLHLVAAVEGYRAITASQLELIQILDFEATLSRRIGSYSHGMMKKLALVASLNDSRSVLIIDEIFNGIDVISMNKMKDFFKRQAEGGKLIMICSHFLQILFGWCSTVFVISNGTIPKIWDSNALEQFGGNYSQFEEDAVRYYNAMDSVASFHKLVIGDQD